MDRLLTFVVYVRIGETKLVVTCRQLLHSTQLYAECLTSLEQVTGGAAASSPQMKASLIKLGNMIENDVVLLREIKQEVDSIDESTAKKSFLHNVVISQWTGRIEKIRQLEAELMARFQVVTAVMMKEVYKVRTWYTMDRSIMIWRYCSFPLKLLLTYPFCDRVRMVLMMQQWK